MAQPLQMRPAGRAHTPASLRKEITMDIQATFSSFSAVGATWVMWLLVGLSVAGLAVTLERAAYLAVRRDHIGKLRSEVMALVRRGDHAGARDRLARSRSFEAQVVAAGLRFPEEGAAAAEE